MKEKSGGEQLLKWRIKSIVHPSAACLQQWPKPDIAEEGIRSHSEPVLQ